MPVRLTIHYSDQPARIHHLEEPGEYLLGRDPECDLVLDDARVSRRHARLSIDPAGGRITDLASKNGLSVDGRAVERSPLADTCWLSLGGLLVRYESGDEASASAARRRRDATLLEHRKLAEAGLEVGELVDRLLASFLELSGTERGFLLLVRGGHRFEVVANRGLTPEAVAGKEFSGSASTVRNVLAGGRSLVRSDALECADSAVRPSIVEGGIRALVCVPLIAAERTLGAVYADSRRPGKAFDELDVEILDALASHAALAMWAAGLKRELEDLARGLPTRVDRDASGVLPLPGFPAWSLAAERERPGDLA